MTPFAVTFMLVSMGAVTLLAAWCMNRILRGPQGTTGDDD